jgi:hypothetical protein
MVQNTVLCGWYYGAHNVDNSNVETVEYSNVDAAILKARKYNVHRII